MSQLLYRTCKESIGSLSTGALITFKFKNNVPVVSYGLATRINADNEEVP